MLGLCPPRINAMTRSSKQLKALERMVEMKNERCMVSRSQKQMMREL